MVADPMVSVLVPDEWRQRGGQKTIVYKQHNCSANVSDQRNMRVEENKLRKNNEFIEAFLYIRL